MTDKAMGRLFVRQQQTNQPAPGLEPVGASKPEFEQLRQFAAIQESGGHCSLPEIGGPRRELRVGGRI
jgi:hypothetical protein